MLSLSHLPAPPPDDKITAYENDGQLWAFTSFEAKQKILEWLGNYNVEVYVGQENARSAYSKYEAKEAFSAHTETIWQRLVAAYYENGVLHAIRQFSLEEDNETPILKKGASFLLKILENWDRVRSYLPQPSRSPSLQTLDMSMPVSSGSIVTVAMHPHTTTLAVVYADDTIRIFGKGRSLTPLLKHRLQSQISKVQWMPYCSSILAVACRSGILIWTLDPVSVVTRPSGSCLMSLAHPSSLPVTSISWHPKGLKLACVGGKGRELILWDVASEQHLTVHSGLATCISSVNWSPNGSRLLAAMATAAIKVFECRNWAYERWSLAYPLQSSVWSSCGRFLLFATVKEPFLFCLPFLEEGGVGGAAVATQVADLSPVLSTCEDGSEVRVGGLVRQLAWDSKSERLAILFKDSKFVAILNTYTHPQLHLAPGGFIKGEDGQVPIHICFQNNVSNGAILTTVWSGGEVKHIPLRYTCHQSQERISTTLPLNQSGFASPTALSHSRLLNASLGPASPLDSSVLRLFTSPS